MDRHRLCRVMVVKDQKQTKGLDAAGRILGTSTREWYWKLGTAREGLLGAIIALDRDRRADWSCASRLRPGSKTLVFRAPRWAVQPRRII